MNESNITSKKSVYISEYTNYITVEDYDAKFDDEFIKTMIGPYFSNLFDDLVKRQSEQKVNLEKASFVEYVRLPGLITDRLFFQFSEKNINKKDNFITKRSFVNNMQTIFIGTLDEKIEFTFNMYDYR